MLDEIYTWLESYAGVSYDFDEPIKEIDASNAFIDPFNWKASIEIILSQLDDACDVIDEYWRAIPENLPSRNKMKRILTQNTLQLIVTNIRAVCTQMNIDLMYEITTMDQLKETVEVISDLLDMMVNHDINEIIKQDLFTQHEEENDDSFMNYLGLSKQDMSQLSFNINAIRESYYDALNNEDDMY